MAKKSFLSKVAGFFGKVFELLWKGLAFVLKGIWGVLAFLFGIIASAISKAAIKASQSASESLERSNGRKPQFSSFEQVKSFEGEAADFEDWLYTSKSTVGIILGARGSGKSALGIKLLENWSSKGRKTCAMGFEDAGLPSWIRNVKNPEETPNGSVLLVDEGGMEFSSRDSMSSANKLLSSLLFIARHKDLSLVFITQNSANLEVNSIRQADYLLLKRPSLLQKDFERGKIKDIYEAVTDDFKALSADKGIVYVYSDQFRGFAKCALPTFWTERASKAMKSKQLVK